MPWTSKRKWYAARSRTRRRVRWEVRYHTNPATVWRRHVVTSSPWGFTRQDRLGAFGLRNEIRKLRLNWREAHSHIPPEFDKAPIKIETTIGEQEGTNK